jgi:hypothetical protein
MSMWADTSASGQGPVNTPMNIRATQKTVNRLHQVAQKLLTFKELPYMAFVSVIMTAMTALLFFSHLSSIVFSHRQHGLHNFGFIVAIQRIFMYSCYICTDLLWAYLLDGY